MVGIFDSKAISTLQISACIGMSVWENEKYLCDFVIFVTNLMLAEDYSVDGVLPVKLLFLTMTCSASDGSFLPGQIYLC